MLVVTLTYLLLYSWENEVWGEESLSEGVCDMVARLQPSSPFPASGWFALRVYLNRYLKIYPGHARRPLDTYLWGEQVRWGAYKNLSSYTLELIPLHCFHPISNPDIIQTQPLPCAPCYGWLTRTFALNCHQFTSPESFDSDRGGNPSLLAGTVLSQ